MLIIGALIGAVFAIRGLFRPFLGLLVLMTLHFVQPGELIPALAPLRLELVYGVSMLAIALFSKADIAKELLKTEPIIRSTILLEAVIILTIPLAIWPGGAAQEATELLKMIILQLLMTLFIDSQDRLRAILWLLSGFVTWFAGSALLAYSRGDFYEVNGVQRAEGINSMVGGPNELAGLLLALLPFVYALMRCSKLYARILLAICAFLALFVLLLTGARISFVALIAVGFFLILRSKRKLLSLAVTGLVVLVVWISLPAQYQQRYLTVGLYAQGGQLDDSNVLRLAIWDAGWRMFQDHPILGVGAGQFPTAYGTIYSGNVHKAWMNPHNLFIQVTCELGLVGLSVFLYFLCETWKANRWIMRHSEESRFKLNHEFALACYLMMIGIAVVSTVSHTLYRPYWYLLAGLVAANRSVTTGLLAVQAKAPDEVPKKVKKIINSDRLHDPGIRHEKRKKKRRYF